LSLLGLATSPSQQRRRSGPLSVLPIKGAMRLIEGDGLVDGIGGLPRLLNAAPVIGRTLCERNPEAVVAAAPPSFDVCDGTPTMRYPQIGMGLALPDANRRRLDSRPLARRRRRKQVARAIEKATPRVRRLKALACPRPESRPLASAIADATCAGDPGRRSLHLPIVGNRAISPRARVDR
jgi:hypothetical protein